MGNKALVVIDLQNDITKNYREIIGNVNELIAWAQGQGMTVAYIQHQNLTASAKNFIQGTRGFELVPELDVVSQNVFVKSKSNALTSECFAAFIRENDIDEFYIAGADATACVKSTCFNMRKQGYTVHVLQDCVTSYSKAKLPEMIEYYTGKGCEILSLADLA